MMNRCSCLDYNYLFFDVVATVKDETILFSVIMEGRLPC